MILSAFGLGLFYSIPLGPLGQIMLNRAVNKGFWFGFSIAIIAALVDFFMCETFLMSITTIGALSPSLQVAFQVAGLVFLVYIGIREFLFSLKKEKKDVNVSVYNEISIEDRLNGKMILKDVFLVGVYYLSNPTYIAFWITFSSLINQKFIYHHNMPNYIIFGIAFSFGVLICQYISIMIARKLGSVDILKGFLKYVSIPLYSISIIYFFYRVICNVIMMR